MLIFILTMPRVNTWNNSYSGKKDLFAIKRKATNKIEESLDGEVFDYDFGDGWGARVSVNKIQASEANKIMRRSKGFYGYEWMVDSILSKGLISSEGVL